MPDPDPAAPSAGQPNNGPVPYGNQPTGYPPQPAAYTAPPQPAVYTQQVPVPVPVPVQSRTQPADRPRPAGDRVDPQDEERHHPQVVIVSHSSLFYWWPVWVVGYLMALFTWSYGQPYAVAGSQVYLHESNNLGVLFFLTVFLVVLITNVEVRGLASLVVILVLVLAAVLLAYFRVWDNVLGWFGDLNVYLNQGAYFWFSTLLLLTWALTTFVLDRMNYWVVKPGQVTRERFWGMGSESYDTENLTLEKRRDDLFRHWILGVGSGDLRIHTFGARHQEIFIPNVLFVGSKVHAVQHLIAQEPTHSGHPTAE